METKHTPGPWEYDATYEKVRQANSSRTESNVIAYQVLAHNARLIAAAPDMATELAALIAHVEGINRAFYVEGTSKALRAAMADQRERLQAARAAIAKARGAA